MRTTRLRVTMRDVSPEVVRVVDVPSTSTLAELHWLLQAAIGWTNTHLHLFDNGSHRWGPEPEDEMLYGDEDGVALKALGPTFRYDYDFGDGWEHDVEVTGPGGPAPALVEGTGACPPEDCGGPHGYQNLLAVVDDPRHPEHDDVLGWLGGRLPAYDPQAADSLVREVAGVVPESVRLVLDLVGDGVRLTPGGRLPRVLVRAVQERRPEWYPLDGRPASVEEDLYPLFALHHVLRQVGLLRLDRGKLFATKDSHDELLTVRRLRRLTKPGTYADVLTTLTLVELAVSGPCQVEVLAARLIGQMHPGWQGAGGQLTQRELLYDLHNMSSTWEALDLIEDSWTPGTRTWAAGPSARTVFPRVAVAAAYEERERASAEMLSNVPAADPGMPTA